jgi:hypothetical protein
MKICIYQRNARELYIKTKMSYFSYYDMRSQTDSQNILSELTMTSLRNQHYAQWIIYSAWIPRISKYRENEDKLTSVQTFYACNEINLSEVMNSCQ